jgi:hypothetical protein
MQHDRGSTAETSGSVNCRRYAICWSILPSSGMQLSLMESPAALRSVVTPSVTVIVPLTSTSQIAGVQSLESSAAARNT